VLGGALPDAGSVMPNRRLEPSEWGPRPGSLVPAVSTDTRGQAAIAILTHAVRDDLYRALGAQAQTSERHHAQIVRELVATREALTAK
jgi:hypothetical protein